MTSYGWKYIVYYLILAALLLAFGGIEYISLNRERQALIQLVRVKSQFQAQTLAQQIDSQLLAVDLGLQNFLQSIKCGFKSGPKINTVIKRKLLFMPQIENIIFFNDQGKIVYSFKKNHLNIEPKLFLEKHKLSWLDFFMLPMKNNIFISRRYDDKFGKFKGFLLAVVDPEVFYKNFKEFENVDMDEVALFDEQGHVVVKWQEDISASNKSQYSIFKHLPPQLFERGGLRSFENKKSIASLYQLPSFSLNIAISQNIDNVLKDWNYKFEKEIFIFFFSSLILFIISYIFIRYTKRIHEYREYEHGLLQDKLASEKANKAKSEFLANMSHEIRTPLNGLLGILQLLKYSNLSSEDKNYIEMATISGNCLLEIINDILDFSKIESGKMELFFEIFSPKELELEAQKVFSPLAAKKNIDFSIKGSDNLPDKLWGDYGKIRQIIFNLLSNAIKFTEQGQVQLIFETKPKGEQVQFEFEVRDTGIGISSEKLKVIFDSFTQADGSNTRKYQGSGLGLSIVKNLVELMHGQIHSKSTPQKGSSFYVYLLLDRPDPNCLEEVEVSKEKVIPTPRKLRLILAEDNAINQLMARRLLEKRGHTVFLAENGLQVLDILKTEADIDGILMDIQMPEMDGLEVTTIIRKNKDNIPIIAMTAHALRTDKEKFIKHGMNAYIPKPIQIDEVENVLYRTILN